MVLSIPQPMMNTLTSTLRRLGRDRVSILTGDKDKSQIKLFLNS